MTALPQRGAARPESPKTHGGTHTVQYTHTHTPQVCDDLCSYERIPIDV